MLGAVDKVDALVSKVEDFFLFASNTLDAQLDRFIPAIREFAFIDKVLDGVQNITESDAAIREVLGVARDWLSRSSRRSTASWA